MRSLYKISIPNNIDSIAAQPPLKLTTIQNVHGINKVGTNIFIQAQEDNINKLYSLNPQTDVLTPITLPCGETCSESYNMFVSENALYLSVFVGTDSIAYKTIDGLNFSTVYTMTDAQYSRRIFASSRSLETNGMIYYVESNAPTLRRFKTDGTGPVDNLSVFVKHMFKTNNKSYVISTQPSKIYEIDSSNSLIERFSTTNEIIRASVGSSVFYFTEQHSSGNDLYKFDTASGSAVLIKNNYSEGCQGAIDREFVNKLSDSYVFDCFNQQTYERKIKLFTKNGVEKTILGLTNGTNLSSPFSFMDETITAIYRGKFIFHGSSDAGEALLALDINDNASIISPASSTPHTSVGYQTQLLVYKDNLFFSGNDYLNLEEIPEYQYELFKYYENP